MTIPAPKDPDLESARDALNLAMQLLTKSLDTPFEGATDDEMEIVRCRRANVMLEAAKRLHNKVCGLRTR